MSIEAKIHEQAQLDQAEAELSEEQLSSVNGGVTQIDFSKLVSLSAANRARLAGSLTANLGGFGLRGLANLDVPSNKEWQE
jgi:hypothetical protein